MNYMTYKNLIHTLLGTGIFPVFRFLLLFFLVKLPILTVYQYERYTTENPNLCESCGRLHCPNQKLSHCR